MTNIVELQTNLGNIRIEMNEEKAPISVSNFLNYVNSGHYDGTIFHRVIKGFMIQGGGFETGLKQKQAQSEITNEANNGLKNDKYTIAMARTSQPHSATNQFFINTVQNDFLNFKSETIAGWGYAVFGKVISGQEIIDQIEKVRTGRKAQHTDVPLEDVVIIKATQINTDTNEPQLS